MTREGDVPEGAAVFPLIPEELDIHPLLLAILHVVVFLEGSDDKVIDPEAAQETCEYLATYLQRLKGPELRRVREDLETLIGFARQEKWPGPNMQFLQSFLTDHGVPEESNS